MTAVLCALFLLSGAAALIFETLWFRQAGLAFGNSVWASSLVLAGFMAGLALGNGWMARAGARITRPVRFYAGLEAVIALTGTGLVWLLPELGSALAPLFRPFLDTPWVLNPLRLGIGFALLVVPATAMGATLPVLVHALHQRDPSFGSVLGKLYGWNTLGAVIGAVAGEAALLEWFGIRGTAFVAAGCNGAAAVIALALSRRLGAVDAPERTAVAAPPPALPSRARRILAAAFGAGAILLAFEVVWFRFLHLFVHSGALVFSLMLAVVLAGIAFGGFGGGLWLRHRPDATRHAPALALAAGAAALLLYAGFSIPVAPHAGALQTRPAIVLGLSAALMLPVSLLSGAIFTLLGTALHDALRSDTRAAGWLTLANTLGAALGSAVAGFGLLPVLGMERSIWLLAAGYGAVAWFARSPERRGSPLRRPAVWAAAAFAAALALFPHGKMEAVYLRLAVDRWNRDGNSRVEVVREGRTETSVLLADLAAGRVVSHRLLTDGFAMSSTTPFARRYQKLYVWWPVAIHPGVRDALLISYGVGNTAQALVETEGIEHIDVVDISREILGLADRIHPDPATRPLLDPRVDVHVEDGRFFLQTTDRRYDLITGEPPPPKNAGVVNLYTREYFALIRERLRDGGITTYWLPVHNTLPSDTKAIVRAFCDVFENCSLWSGQDLDWMLVGSRGALEAPSEAAFTRPWRDAWLERELYATALERPELLGTLFMADAQQLAAWVADAPPLTDDRPKRLSDRRHGPIQARRAYRDWLDPARNRERFEASAWIESLWPPALRDRTVSHFDVHAVIESAARREPIGFGQRLRSVHALLAAGAPASVVEWRLGVSDDRMRAVESQIAAGASPDPHRLDLARRATARGDFAAAAAWLAPPAGPKDWRSLYLRWYALEMAGKHDDAQAWAQTHRRALTAGTERRAAWEFMAETFGAPE